jgi:predicted component of type VI protein secretion system
MSFGSTAEKLLHGHAHVQLLRDSWWESQASAMVRIRHGLAMVIKVQLRDPQTGSEKTFEFDQSPIRIGRNALNNVVIEDRFVSQWHGMIKFDDTSASYSDLGSTNGTRFEGKRLTRNTAILLRGPAPLAISRFEIQVVASPAVPGAADAAATKAMSWGEAKANSPRLAPPLATPCQTSEPDRMNRLQRILDGFSEAFVALKKGYEEFGAEVGVRPLAGSTALHRARTGREVMDHLLTLDRDVDGCLRDLRAVFADMGIHHIAMMEGITQGIRALLESLDPKLQDAQAGLGAFSRSRSRAEWTRYQERFATLIAEDTALHAEIFGAEFARAYASVALAPAGQSDHSDE